MKRARTAGLSTTSDGFTRRLSGPPLVELRFSRSRYPAAGQDPFAPLRLPERRAVMVQGAVHRSPRRGLFSFTAELRPGAHNLPLSRFMPCRVEVPAGCTLEERVDIGEDRHKKLRATFGLHGRVSSRERGASRCLQGVIVPLGEGGNPRL